MLSQNEVKNAIENRQAFRTKNINAIYENEVYNIYSYDTLIYREYKSGVKILNTLKYSQTTSKLQNVIKEVLNVK